MPTPYPAAAVANFFIGKNESSRASLTHLKIQKLLYYAQGWFMANYDGSRLFDENIEAWKHGPVVRSVYKALSGSKDSQITNKINTVYGQVYGPHEIDPNDESTLGFLNQFWEQFYSLDAYALTNSTHLRGTPWRTVYEQNDGYLGWGELIPDSLICEYFSTQKQQAEQVAI